MYTCDQRPKFMVGTSEIQNHENDRQRFGQKNKFVRDSIRGTPPARGSVGLRNIGNSCYLNSILQCLNQIAPLVKYFIDGTYLDHINKGNPLGSGGKVAAAYANFLTDVWSGDYEILSPRTLKDIVGAFAPRFNNRYQHDSQEFLSFFLDGLHEDCNRVLKKPYVEDLESTTTPDKEMAIESWRRHLLRHNSFIVDHCQGIEVI